MAFIDEVKINIKAGDGGDGVVRWRHLKNKELAGPSGGDGGAGGDVFARAIRNVHLLSRYRTKKSYFAEKGGDGKKDSFHGADGKELVLLVPVGSIITNLKTNEKYFLNKEGDKVLLLKAGKGGRGNESFKSSTNTTPKECTKGAIGEEANFFIEVE
ncbi:MAG: GTPase ObgE, partial [Patescibacteria group bacterium]